MNFSIQKKDFYVFLITALLKISKKPSRYSVSNQV